MDISAIFSNEITHLFFALVIGVLAMVGIVAMLLIVGRWLHR